MLRNLSIGHQVRLTNILEEGELVGELDNHIDLENLFPGYQVSIHRNEKHEMAPTNLLTRRGKSYVSKCFKNVESSGLRQLNQPKTTT